MISLVNTPNKKNSEETKKATLKCSKVNGPTFISLKTDKMLNNW